VCPAVGRALGGLSRARRWVARPAVFRTPGGGRAPGGLGSRFRGNDGAGAGTALDIGN